MTSRSSGPASAARTGSQTLTRGLDLLDEVVDGPMRLADLAQQTGLKTSTVQRLASALLDRGFLRKLPQNRLVLGPKLMQLGYLAREQVGMLDAAKVHAEQLADKIGICVFVGCRDGDWSLHLHRARGRQRIEVSSMPGTRRPIADTGLGKALLLDDDPASWRRLLEIARQGSVAEPESERWCREMQQAADAGVVLHQSASDENIRSVAAPVRDAAGHIVGAISVASAVQYLGEHRMREIAPEVRGTALAISDRLGFRAR